MGAEDKNSYKRMYLVSPNVLAKVLDKGQEKGSTHVNQTDPSTPSLPSPTDTFRQT